MGEMKRSTDEPVIVTTVGTGTGDGNKPLPQGSTTAVTPDHLPNIVIQVVQPVVVIMVRSLKVFVNTLLGLLAAEMVTNVIPATDFFDLLTKCAGLSVAAGVVAMITNVGELLARIDQKFPTYTA